MSISIVANQNIPIVYCAVCRKHVEIIEVDPMHPLSVTGYCHGAKETQPFGPDTRGPTFFVAEARTRKMQKVKSAHAKERRSFASSKRNGWRHTQA